MKKIIVAAGILLCTCIYYQAQALRIIDRRTAQPQPQIAPGVKVGNPQNMNNYPYASTSSVTRP